MSELEKAFLKFANYKSKSVTGSDMMGTNFSNMCNNMTGKNFSKMCQECGVMDGTAVNHDDVAIAFNKVRIKGAYTINYVQFLQAMKVLCGKRFREKLPEDALQATFKLLEGKEPANEEAAKSVMANGEERLINTGKHADPHTQHCKKSGKGKGTRT